MNHLNIICYDDYDTFELLFPVSNETDLQVLETKLRKDLYYRKLLTLRLMTLGGEQMVHTIRLMMAKLFDDTLLETYAFDDRGYKNKKDFSKLEINNVLFHALLEQPRYKDRYYEVKRLIKAYLSQSSYRAKRQANENNFPKGFYE